MFSSTMLLTNLIPLIGVTFSTPTPVNDSNVVKRIEMYEDIHWTSLCGSHGFCYLDFFASAVMLAPKFALAYHSLIHCQMISDPLSKRALRDS
jgi:hypothetical protein